MIVIPNMPLYWRFKDTPGRNRDDPPGQAPFTFDHDPHLDLFIEGRSPRLTALLADIYSRNANVGYLQDGHSLVSSYGADFWEFLSDLLAGFHAKNVLEIGPGGCVLLERLKEQGCNVVGVDPSPVAAEAGRRKGIEIIQEFFPPRSLPVRPDLIFQVDVLEHIEAPVPFLAAQADALSPDGLIVVNVPDCSESLRRGDISMALHQHVNMFDNASLETTLRAAGLEVVKLERSKYGSALFCAARKGSPVQPSGGDARGKLFETKANASIDRFQTLVADSRKRGETIGFFIPQRAFPYLGVIGWFEGFRIFDNMNVWHNRYLDGIDVPVENQQDLIARPVDHVFVMSLSFGKEVGDALRASVPGMHVTTLDEILGPRDALK